MANIDLIKELRYSTNLSIRDITKAVTDANGDREKALELLKEIGALVSNKKSDRSTNEGIIESYIHTNGKIGVLLELLCETDFVAKNPSFPELAHEVSMHIAAMDPETPDALLEQDYIKDPSIKVRELIEQCVAKLGEKIKVGKFVRYSL